MAYPDTAKIKNKIEGGQPIPPDQKNLRDWP